MAAATAPMSSFSSRPSDGDEDDLLRSSGRLSEVHRRRRPLPSLTTILGRVVELAQEPTGARYGALGVFAERRPPAVGLQHEKNARADAPSSTRGPATCFPAPCRRVRV
jgi:hypothetical protein